MRTADIIAFKDYILKLNTYFQVGFYNAYKDLEAKKIFAKEDAGSAEHKAVFPEDKFGNYFYIRNEGEISHQEKFDERLSDCSSAYNDSLSITLIAVIGNVDALTVIENLRNTCNKYRDLKAIPSNSNFNKEKIIKEEMSGFDAKVIADAMKRSGKKVIIRMRLTLNKVFIPTNCIVDPCKNC